MSTLDQGRATPFARLLVANRGEIARRVTRGAHSAGLDVVAVFADDDRSAPFVAEADLAVSLGAGPSADTYLNVEAIVAAAAKAGADAVHPGYGFLSEDPALAQACAAAGLVFIGPPAAAIAAMGHKARAKALVAAAGVPVLPSAVVDDASAEDPAALKRLAEGVGFPLLVKASAGGGGRGMRLVEQADDLADAVAAARREARSSFGSDDVFLERYLQAPRHIEVQVVADRHGSVLHLFDRECSVQRRHQKVIEEAPAVLVPQAARRGMWAAAVQAARAVAYENLGTVEFVVEGDDYFFLEMNTRLQVEHGVTELVTGLDLVALQLAVAAGQPLGMGQDDVTLRGHAVEARLCAERPSDDYRPMPGAVAWARWPAGDHVRCDTGVETGSVVSPAYDSLVAKVMARGADRASAVGRLGAALRAVELDGIETNRDLLVAVLGDAEFARGEATTDFLGRRVDLVNAGLAAAERRRHAVAAALFLEHARHRAALVAGLPPSWRNVGVSRHTDRFDDHGQPLAVTVVRAPWAAASTGVPGEAGPAERLAVEVSGPEADGDWRCSAVRVAVTVPPAGRAPGATSGLVDLELDGVSVRLGVRVHDHAVCVSSPAGQSELALVEADDSAEVATAAGECRAPLPGSVTQLLVAAGDQVAEGVPLVVLEAMKMEHTLRAGGPGSVSAVEAVVGQQVEVGQLLVTVEPAR